MRLQSGIPRSAALPTRGLLVLGQVRRVYLPDDPMHPALQVVAAKNGPVVAGVVPTFYVPLYPPGLRMSTLCDVQPFGGRRGPLLRFVPILQQGYGRNDAAPWIPQGARFSATDDAVKNETLPGDLDGDIVLLGFLEGNPNLPVILGALAHPNAQQLPPAYRFPSPVQGPATERVIRHRGSKVTIDSDGNVTVDATSASSGACDVKGAELPGVGGLITIKANVTQTVRIEGGSVEMAQPGALANRLVARAQDTTLADATTDAAWAAFWNAVQADIAALPVAPNDGGLMLRNGLALLFGAHGTSLTGAITSGNANVRTDT